VPDFKKPTFQFAYNVVMEVDNLRAHKLTRAIPAKSAKTLLIATWNTANLGTQDFNMPKAKAGDPIFTALTSKGLVIPPHASQVGSPSAIASDSEYDQVAFFPGATSQDFTGQKGVLDYDKVIFPALWGPGTT
jgi:hypothetical protein